MSLFNVCLKVQEEIALYDFSVQERIVLYRCIGGYSQAKTYYEKMEKMKYQIFQLSVSNADWYKCVSIFEAKKNLINEQNSHEASKVFYKNLTAEHFWDVAVKESEENKLRRLINENSESHGYP